MTPTAFHTPVWVPPQNDRPRICLSTTETSTNAHATILINSNDYGLFQLHVQAATSPSKFDQFKKKILLAQIEQQNNTT